MTPIEEYITLPRETRRAHLNLKSPCIERGGDSFQMRGLLAHVLDTTIPAPRSGRKAHVCHACHNGACSNPSHLYWGAYRDNRIDSIENGTPISPYHHNVARIGVDEANLVNKRSSQAAALSGQGNRGKNKSPEHKKALSKAASAAHARRKNKDMC